LSESKTGDSEVKKRECFEDFTVKGIIRIIPSPVVSLAVGQELQGYGFYLVVRKHVMGFRFIRI
jgi:hypothetical protein